jgi:hypothetical protein
LLSGNVIPAVVRARHYTLLLPLGFVAVAVAVEALHELAARRLARRWLADAARLGIVGTLLASPLWSVTGYYQRAERDGRTNRAVLAAADSAMRGESRDAQIYVDLAFERELTLSGGTLLNNLLMIFEIRGQAVGIYDGAVGPLWVGTRPVRLVLRPESAMALAPRYRLVPLPGRPGGRGAAARGLG